MVEMVETRRNAETKEERHDLFSGLLDAAFNNLDGDAAIVEEESSSVGATYHTVSARKGFNSQFQRICSSSFSLGTR